MRHSADFITQREIKICLGCGWPYSTALKSCPQCHDRAHTKTMLIVAAWKTLPPYFADGGSGPGVRVTNFGNAI